MQMHLPETGCSREAGDAVLCPRSGFSWSKIWNKIFPPIAQVSLPITVKLQSLAMCPGCLLSFLLTLFRQRFWDVPEHQPGAGDLRPLHCLFASSFSLIQK